WNGAPRSIKVPPGAYIARIKAGSDSSEIGFEILPDPNYKTTITEYKEQFDFLITVRDKFNEVQKAVTDIRGYRGQINDFIKRQGKDIDKDVKTLADSVNR